MCIEFKLKFLLVLIYTFIFILNINIHIVNINMIFILIINTPYHAYLISNMNIHVHAIRACTLSNRMLVWKRNTCHLYRLRAVPHEPSHCPTLRGFTSNCWRSGEFKVAAEMTSGPSSPCTRDSLVLRASCLLNEPLSADIIDVHTKLTADT